MTKILVLFFSRFANSCKIAILVPIDLLHVSQAIRAVCNHFTRYNKCVILVSLILLFFRCLKNSQRRFTKFGYRGKHYIYFKPPSTLQSHFTNSKAPHLKLFAIKRLWSNLWVTERRGRCSLGSNSDHFTVCTLNF